MRRMVGYDSLNEVKEEVKKGGIEEKSFDEEKFRRFLIADASFNPWREYQQGDI